MTRSARQRRGGQDDGVNGDAATDMRYWLDVTFTKVDYKKF